MTSPQTVPAAVDAAALRFAGSVAVAEPGGPVLTYRELREAVRGVAGALIASGIEAGDRVAIWSPNTHHWVLGALGALYAGATLVPVNTRYTGHEALDVLTRTRARALLVTGPFLGTDRLTALAGAGAELPELVVQIPVEPGRGGEALDWAGFATRTADPADIDRRAPPSPPATSATSCSPPAPPAGARARCPPTGRHSTSRGPGPTAPS